MSWGFDGIPADVAGIVKKHMMIAAGAGAPGVFLPLVDEAAIAGCWGRMFYQIGQKHGVSLKPAECAKIGAACIAGLLAYKTGSRILTWLVTIVSLGLAIPTAIAGNVGLNAYYTRSVGLAFHKWLETDGINGRTAYDMAKILLRYFNPLPSLGDVRHIVKQLKGEID